MNPCPRRCQSCNRHLSAADRAADPYTKLCLTCWTVWQGEAGVPLKRYGQPGTVCADCGMMFGGLTGFDRHRHAGKCRSPAELKAQNRPLTVKAGIWVKNIPEHARIYFTQSPRSHVAKIPMETPPLSGRDAQNRLGVAPQGALA